jgi:predicted GNAT family N-acyltransferase
MILENVSNINIHKVDYASPEKRFFILHIRKKVFVEEQNVNREDEFDEFDTTSNHYLAYYGPIKAGTARWRITEEGIKLERFAILKKYRNKGIGTAILNKVMEVVKKEGKKIYLHAQLPAIKFYERAGFVKEGNMFSECNIDHYKMVYKGN